MKSLETSKREETFLFLRLPYLGSVLLQIEEAIQHFLIKRLSTKFRFNLVHDTHNIGKCCKFEDRKVLLLDIGVIYQLNCSCGKSYLGQILRNLITRI